MSVQMLGTQLLCSIRQSQNGFCHGMLYSSHLCRGSAMVLVILCKNQTYVSSLNRLECYLCHNIQQRAAQPAMRHSSTFPCSSCSCQHMSFSGPTEHMACPGSLTPWIWCLLQGSQYIWIEILFVLKVVANPEVQLIYVVHEHLYINLKHTILWSAVAGGKK